MAKRKLWTYLAATVALAVGLSSVALGADISVNGSSTGPGLPGVTLPASASSVASAVIGALTGGSNPSTAAASEKSNSSSEQANTDKDNEAADNDEANQAVDNDEAGHEGEEAGTTGTKPGWGCGDDNHTHSGPPGRPGATPPPGCAKSH